jgi:sporulation protein YlmC with PRC-barrel domain
MFSPDRFCLGRKHVFAKYITAALAGTALLATVASAQTPTTTTDRADTASANTAMTLPDSSLQGNWRASKVVGLAVYNDNNDSVGTINDLLMDKSGNIKAVVLGVGGFLGVGEHLVAVPFDKVKFVDTRVPSTTATSSNSPASSTTTGSASTSTNAATSKSNPWYPDHAVFNATKDELKAMPEFKYST